MAGPRRRRDNPLQLGWSSAAAAAAAAADAAEGKRAGLLLMYSV